MCIRDRYSEFENFWMPMNPFQTLRSLNAKMRFTHALCEAVEGQVSSISTYFVLLVFVTTFKSLLHELMSPWVVKYCMLDDRKSLVSIRKHDIENVRATCQQVVVPQEAQGDDCSTFSMFC